MAKNPDETKHGSQATSTAEEKLDFDDVTLKAIADVYKNEGNEAYRRKDFSNAVHFYTEGIKVNCKDDELNAKLYSNRATAHFYLGNYRETLTDTKAAVDLQPTYLKAIERGANACVKLRRHKEAIAWCDKGLTIIKSNKILLDIRSRAVDERNKLQESKQVEIQNGLSKNQTGKGKSQIVTSVADGIENLSTIFESTEDSKNALEKYKMHLKCAEVIKDKTTQAIMFCAIGNAYRRLGDFKQAIHYHEFHLKLAKEEGDRSGEGCAYGNLGNAYYDCGDFKKGIHYHELCINIAKEVGSRFREGGAYGNLGNCHQGLGDFKKAVHYHDLQLKIAKEVDNREGEGDAYGNLGNNYLSLGDLKKAIYYHELNLCIAKEAGNRFGEGSAYCSLGTDYRCLGHFKKAINCHERCLKIASEIGNRAEEGRAYGNLGIDYNCLGDFKKALYHHELHLEIAKQSGNRAEEGIAYGNLGKAYHSLGDFKKAIQYYECCLKIVREVGSKSAEGRTYGLLGSGYYSLGDFKKAINFHNRDLEISKDVGNRAGEGCAYGNLGISYHQLGDFKKAIHYNGLCLKIAREVGDKYQEGSAHCNLGNAYHSLGDFKKATHFHKLHLEVSRLLSTRSEEGTAYQNLGNDYHSLGDLRKAIHYHKLHLRIAQEVHDMAGEGDAYGNLGNDYRNLGDLKEAIRYHELHLEIAKEVGNRAREGSAYGNLANAYGDCGDIKTTIHYYELQLEFAKDVGNRAGEIAAYNNLGCTFELQGSLLQAATYFQSGVRVLNNVRGRLQLKDEWKISLRHLYQMVYNSLWRVLLNQGKVVEGLIAAEQGRTQALKDLMKCKYGLETNEDDSRTPDEAIFDIISCLPSNTVFVAATKREVVSWFIQKGKNVDIRTKQISDNKSDEVITFFNSLMEVAFGEIGVRTGVKCEDRSLEKLRDEEQDDERPDHTQTRSLHLQSSALRTLYEFTIGPIEDLIEGDELIIVPDGPLWLAPYAAFVDPNSMYLSESFRIRVIPSLTSMKLIADSSADYHHKSRALLVGDPWVQDVKLQQLPCAREEVEMIGRILNTAPLTGKDATKEEVLKRISSVALVHIAAHGRMETGEIALAPKPTTSSQTPTEEDFLLTMTDVLNVHIRARLVVLSCCHSGRGEVKAEGVVGIARAFLGAGARSVLVSLWAIDDEATLEFMKNFYQHLLKGRCASESLNQAMKFMRESEKFNKVKYWAPFVLIGDDVTLEFSGSD